MGAFKRKKSGWLMRFLSVMLMTKAFTVFMFCINYLHDVYVCHLILQHSFSLLCWLILYESELNISSGFTNPGFGYLIFSTLVFCRQFCSRLTDPFNNTEVRLAVLHVPQCHNLHNHFQQECE